MAEMLLYLSGDAEVVLNSVNVLLVTTMEVTLIKITFLSIERTKTHKLRFTVTLFNDQ